MGVLYLLTLCGVVVQVVLKFMVESLETVLRTKGGHVLTANFMYLRKIYLQRALARARTARAILC